MARWQLQEAKQKFSEVVRRARDDGPQMVTRHGEEIVVILDIQAYRHLAGQDIGLKDFLRAEPMHLDDLEMHRDEAPAREIEL